MGQPVRHQPEKRLSDDPLRARTPESDPGLCSTPSSMVGEIGRENHAAYVATKGGIGALTKSNGIGQLCAALLIRVNAVCPAGVWTPMLRKWAGEQPDTHEIESYLNHIHPLGYCPRR